MNTWFRLVLSTLQTDKWHNHSTPEKGTVSLRGECVAVVPELGSVPNELDICVYYRMNKHGMQCTLCIHVDDLLITSKSKEMIAEMTDGLRIRYGETWTYD